MLNRRLIVCFSFLNIQLDPLFGLGANVALIFSGQYVRWVSGLRAGLGAGVDPWAVSLKYLMGAVIASGGVLVGTYTWMLKNVIKDAPVKKSAPKKKKVKMTLRESANFLMSSPYIRNLATLVVGYGMCINLVEVSWKSKLKVCTAMWPVMKLWNLGCLLTMVKKACLP